MDKSKSALSLAAALLCLAAAPAHADNTQDPYERYNRAMFGFNETADRYVLAPVARGYRKVTPKPVRSAVGNFFNNLRDINSFGSNILRGNIKNAGYDFMRVAVNTTFGLGGLIDIADEAGMQNNKNTLGDTFASWGWKNSNYLVLPLLGPSTVRDGAGTAIHTLYSPTDIVHERAARYALTATDGIDRRERLLDTTDALEEVSLDKYIVTRNAYIAYRNQQLGIAAPESSEEELTDPEADWQEDNAAASQPESTQDKH